VLQNKRKPLRLGYAMVRNRTQRELAAGVTLQQAHAAEQRFLAEHPVFGQLSKSESLFGIEALTKRCVGLLVTRIKTALPNIKWELQQSLLQVCTILILVNNVSKSHVQIVSLRAVAIVWCYYLQSLLLLLLSLLLRVCTRQ
jgi:Dynamin central region